MKSGNNQLSQGLGGYAADNTGNKLFMGGGGGAGHSNEVTGTSGGNGGGIVIIDAKIITTGSSATIFANGITAGNAPYDGAGGGGGGGTILLKTSTILGQLFLEAQGGYGGKVAIHRDGRAAAAVAALYGSHNQQSPPVQSLPSMEDTPELVGTLKNTDRPTAVQASYS